MGQWKIDTSSSPGVLLLTLQGALEDAEVQAFVRAHNAAIDALGNTTYRVFVDLREMLPLSPAGAAAFETAKQHSASKPNFQGSAVLVSSQVVAMQHRRTSGSGGVLDSELISDDEAACWEHLRRVRRDNKKR